MAGIEVTAPKDRNEKKKCESEKDTIVGSGRMVLEGIATGADIASLGLLAGGVTGPIAIGVKGVGWIAEAGLWGINLFDARVNGNYGPLQTQVAGAGASDPWRTSGSILPEGGQEAQDAAGQPRQIPQVSSRQPGR